MNIVICDDDKNSLLLLQKMILEFFRKEALPEPYIKTYPSAEAMLLTTDSYDLAFLDVEMPGVSGLVATQELKKRNKRILVFIITGYSDTYLDESFDAGVYRYLTKPVNRNRLYHGLKNALLKLSAPNKRILITHNNENRYIDTDDILFLQAVKRHTEVTIGSETITCSITYHEWKDILPEGCFFESYKGTTVNLKHVVSFSQTTIRTDVPGQTTYLSKRKYKELQKKFLLFLENE